MKSKLWAMLIVMIVFFSGCSSVNTESTSKIVAPKNNSVAISGTWKFVKIINDDLKLQVQLLNTNVQFSEDAIVMDGYAWKLPNYKVKKVNVADYTLNKYSQLFNAYKFKSSNLDIITITSNEQYFCELIKINDNEAIIDTQNYTACLEKVSDSIDKKLINMALNSSEFQESQSYSFLDNDLHTGVLLGLASQKQGEDKVSYNTLWISANNRKLQPVYETEGIFFPRKTGFWRLNVDRVKEKGREFDKLYATEAFLPTKIKDVNVNPLSNTFDSIFKKIVYVCNDYISFESTSKKKEGEKTLAEERYQVQHADNLLTGKGITIDDLLGDVGEKAIESGRENALKKLEGSNLVDYNYYNENYKLYRKSGHWYLKGRIAYLTKDNYNYKDYNISLIPPENIVVYDNLCLPWKEIKDKVPNALDAYTSPNEDLAIIITQDKILIYSIENNKLQGTPMKKVKINSGDSVIMAEWVRGKYMDSWNKSFLKNKYEIAK